MNELALFAGAGGGILGGKLLGWNTVGAVEIEKFPRECLLARQKDGVLPRFPVWDDVCSFDGKPWRGCVDVVSGGFPCQDISAAGKGAGIDGARSGLWKEMFRIICEIRPKYAFMENSPMLTSRGLGVVLGDLAEAGYDAEWMVLGAADVGAPHRRDRMWILARDREQSDVADSGSGGRETRAVCQRGERQGAFMALDRRSKEENPRKMVDADGVGWDAQQYEAGEFGEALGAPSEQQFSGAGCGAGNENNWWSTEPDVGRVADGVAARVDRLKAIGNGQVPLVAATAFVYLLRRFDHEIN